MFPRESWVVYLASLIYVHIFKNNNILFILDVSDLSMDIWKEAAVLRQLFMILFAFYLQVDINNNTPSASGWMLPRYYAAKHMCYLVNIESP